MMMPVEHNLRDRRILIIPEYGKYGGTFSFLKRLLDIHKKNDIQTAVLIPESQKISEALSLFEDSGVRVFSSFSRTPIFFNSYLSPFYDILFSIKAILSFRPDVIVVSYGSTGIMSGVLFYPLPVLFVLHGYPMERLYFPTRLFWRVFSRLNNIFLTVSEFSKERINQFIGIPLNRINVVCNSVGESEADNKANKDLIVLTVGHMEDYKNPECWLKVAKRVIKERPDVKFIWLGDGTLFESMKKNIQGEGLDRQLILPGYSDKAGSYYDKALVYFQPSLQESHGISVLQAMAHGLPCVVSSIGGLPESVTNGETGFTCDVKDVDLFAAKILELFNSPSLAEKMGNAGRKRAEESFSEEIQEEKIVNFYNLMLQSQHK